MMNWLQKPLLLMQADQLKTDFKTKTKEIKNKVPNHDKYCYSKIS